MAKSKMQKFTAPTELSKIVVAKYIRVSTDKQREEGYSIEIQKERLTSYTSSLFPSSEYNVEFREYVDDGFSGGSLDRPRMTKLIEDVIAGEITHVVVIKLDRLSRSQKDTLHLIEDIFLPNNVAFISMGESFSTDTPFGRAVIGILSVFAQLERENIFERTRSGMQKRVELGFWPGGGNVPFGYDYDRNQGVLVPNKDAETVRRIYDLYIQGNSMQSIADICGLKYEKLVQQIIARKSNTGVITYNGMEYQGKHDAIISVETYQRAMELMTERSEKHFVSATDHLLTGLLYCEKCGAKMRYQKWGKAGWKLVCYSQQTSKKYLIKDPDCDNPKCWADDVEDAVLETIFSRATDPIEDGNVCEDVHTAIDMLSDRKNELEKKLKRLYLLYADDDNDVLVTTIHEVKEEISIIEKKLEKEREKDTAMQYVNVKQKELVVLKDYWTYMSSQEQREIVRSLLNRVTVGNDSIHVDFKY